MAAGLHGSARTTAPAVLEGKALQLAGGKDSLAPPAGRNTYAWHIAEGRADLALSYCSGGERRPSPACPS